MKRALLAVGAVLVLGLPLLLLGLVVMASTGATRTCVAPPSVSGDAVWSGEQRGHAHTITHVTAARALPRRAAVIAVTTAIVETGLRNLDHGDRDSLGLFQQRPSQGWGSRAQVTDPVYATGAFLDRLVRIPHWADPGRVAVGQAAQAVQRSAYPERYEPRAPQARALVEEFWTGPEHPSASAISEPTMAAAATVCPDEGGSNLPLDPHQLPADFALPTDPRQHAVVTFALAQLGKPYVNGAKGPDAFDCSGLTQAAWANAGVTIPAGTRHQRNTGDPVTHPAALQPGDLLFIPGAASSRGNPRHVGLYAGHGFVVNAYDEHTGVVLDRLEQWTDQIVLMRRPAGAAS